MVEPTVFVVDDDRQARESLSWLLRQADLRVESFSSGREFLDAYSRHQKGCLVLDVRMPQMNGFEVQRELLASGIELPIIFITGHCNLATFARTYRSRGFDVLQKPLDDTALLERIRRAMALNAEQGKAG